MLPTSNNNIKKCNKCETILKVPENWSKGRRNKCDYICKICIRERKKSWRLSNPDSKKKSDKRYYSTNKSKIYPRVKKWKQDNKQKEQEYQKNYRPFYRKNNRGKINNHAAARRTRLKHATVGNHQEKLELIYKNCPKGYHVDHIVPLKGKDVSGLHVPWNLQYLPALENIKKGNRHGSK